MTTDELENLLPSWRERSSAVERVSARLRPAPRDTARTPDGCCGNTVGQDAADKFSAQVDRSARERLAAALDDGSWDEAVRAAVAGDVDLAT